MLPESAEMCSTLGSLVFKHSGELSDSPIILSKLPNSMSAGASQS